MHLQLASGDRVGDWVIVEPLGHGGMGSVYKAHNSLTKQVQAAIKVLTLTHDAGAKARFVREIEVLASLDHPVIVRVLGGGSDPRTGLLFLAMELVDGRDLTWYIDDRALPWADACRVTRDVSSALAEAHSKGVHHRDLKPANIMLAAGGKVKLIDFGIALRDGQTRLTRAKGIPGTMSYMPPEIFTQGKGHDAVRGDIYSLGVCLCEMLTGERAYPEDPTLTTVQRYAAVMGAKARDEYLDPGEGVPEGVRELVKAATQRDPARRIADAQAMRAALDALIEGESIGPIVTPAPAERRPKSTEDTFTLEGAILEPPPPPKKKKLAAKPPPPPKKAEPREEERPPGPITHSPRRGRFPGISLGTSVVAALGPPVWGTFWFLVTLILPELGALVLALSLIFLPVGLPLLALLGVAATVWFMMRTQDHPMRLFWWLIAVFLCGIHLWHMVLSVLDTALLITLAQQVVEESSQQQNWRDLLPH